jgi:hypothetical protein
MGISYREARDADLEQLARIRAIGLGIGAILCRAHSGVHERHPQPAAGSGPARRPRSPHRIAEWSDLSRAI